MRGQAFTVFKMLIGGVFAMAMLMLIYQAVGNVSCPTYAFDEILDLSVQASRMPGGCFEKRVCFDKGTILSSSAFTKNSVLNSVSFDTSNDFCSSSSKCVLDYKVNLYVKVKCSTTSSCKVFIGDRCP